MSQTAGYLTKLQIAPDSTGSAGSYATLANNPKAKIDLKMATVTTTPLGGSGDETKAATIQSFTVSGDVFYDHSDTATGTLEGAVRTQVWAKCYTTATNFISGPCLVTGLSYSEDAAGVSSMSFTLESTGPITRG